MILRRVGQTGSPSESPEENRRHTPGVAGRPEKQLIDKKEFIII